MAPLLSVKDLRVCYRLPQGYVEVLRGVSFELEAGEVLGVVGESGSGKSTLALAVAGLLPPNAKILGGSVVFDGTDITRAKPQQLDALRGTGIFMVFQDPFMSLNPLMRVGDQIAEAIKVRNKRQNRPNDPKQAKQETVELLRRVRIADPEDVAQRFPHQLSGGQNQRVMIAMALAEKPKLIIADEPTTALDVTTQAQILSIFREIVEQEKIAIMFITHDLAVASAITGRVAVIYRGQIQEIGPTRSVLLEPKHPYTVALVKSVPNRAKSEGKLETGLQNAAQKTVVEGGCVYASRCPHVYDACVRATPRLIDLGDRQVRCVRYGELYEE